MGYADGEKCFRVRVATQPSCVVLLSSSPGSAPSSLRMRDHVKNNADVALDDEIESPVFVDASLPQILYFVILLGVE